LYAYDSGEVMLDGGEINGYFYVAGNTQVTMSGGLVNCLHVDGSSRVTMSGGTVYHHSLRLESNAILALDGSDFAIDENPFSVGEITSLLGSDYSQEPYRWLTGTLANGDIINNQFQIGNNAKIVLIPEPATLFLLSLGGLILRKRKE